MSTGTKIATIGLLIVLVIVLGAGWLLRRGFSAKAEPTSVEAYVARHLRHLAVPRAARKMPNPVPLTQEVLGSGRAHFADHCATCHGNDGRGATTIGRNLYPKAPDMTGPQTQSLSDGELFYIIKNGVRFTGMPAWGEDTHEDDLESWHLVHFIRLLPKITEDEIREMESLNPKTPDEWREEETEKRFLEGEDVPRPVHEHHHE